MQVRVLAAPAVTRMGGVGGWGKVGGTLAQASQPGAATDRPTDQLTNPQVGCTAHELLVGCLPFETDDKLLAAALVLWADVASWPDTLSPECVSFLQVVW